MTLAAVAGLGLVAGCGGSTRKAVADYITEVNSVEQQMKVPLNEMLKSYAQFSTRGTKLQTIEPRLVQARRTLRTLDDRLGRLDPPEPARPLHRLLLQLVGLEIGLAGEVDRIALFLPQFGAVVSQIGPADTRLAEALAASPTPKPRTIRGTRTQIAAARADYTRRFARAGEAQAAAIDVYRAELDVLAAELRRLNPPQVLRPTYESELTTLSRLRGTGGELANALRLRHYAEIPLLNHRFVAAARSRGSLTTQRAQIAAIEGYNERIRALNRLTGRVQREQSRLGRELG